MRDPIDDKVVVIQRGRSDADFFNPIKTPRYIKVENESETKATVHVVQRQLDGKEHSIVRQSCSTGEIEKYVMHLCSKYGIQKKDVR